MEVVEIPVQEECTLEILEVISDEVKLSPDESNYSCGNNSNPVNSVLIDIEVEENSSSAAEAAQPLDDSVSLKPMLKRRYNASACVTQSKFKDKKGVLDLLLHSATTMCTVPNEAEESYFVLADKSNVRKNSRLRRKQAFNIDNRKGWIFSSLKRHYFVVINETLEYVHKIDGKYYWPIPSSQRNQNEKRLSNQSLFTFNRKRKNPPSTPQHNNLVRLTKQPVYEEVLILTMMHGLTGDFKRRISFIEKFPVDITPKQENLIVAEYTTPSAGKYCAKETKLSAIKQKSAPNLRNRTCNSHNSGIGVQEDVQNDIASDSNEQAVAANEAAFLEKNELIQKHLIAETTLDEIPFGKKEDEVIIIRNDDNYKREAEGKKRMYIDDCGVWKNVSVKRCCFVKIDGKYENVKYADGKYQIANSAIRSRTTALKKCNILAMRWVYGSLRRDPAYRRRISWIDSFPKDVTPKQRHIAIVEYIGKYPGTNDVPHGNQKKVGGGPYVRTSSKMMEKMKEQLVSKTASQVVADTPDLKSTPQLRKKLENLRYRNSLRVCPGSVGTIETMHELLSLVRVNPYVQQVTFIKKMSPLVIAYAAEHMNSWKTRLSTDSNPQVMGVDCTFTLGPVYLTAVTYLHPNLLCRHTGRSAVMLGPILVHIDRSVHAYTSFFNHVKDQLGCYKPDMLNGITLALGPREDEPLLQALDSCFPSSRLGHCVEHLENELRNFLTSEIGLTEYQVNHISNELFSKVMLCNNEFDFKKRLTNLQSAYDVVHPKLGTFFQKLGNDIKVKYWEPVVQGVPLMKWSPDQCPALQIIASSAETLENVCMSSVVQKIQHATSSQLQDEVLAITDKGPYTLAPHAMKYFHEDAEWLGKTAKQKSRVISNLRKLRLVKT